MQRQGDSLGTTDQPILTAPSVVQHTPGFLRFRNVLLQAENDVPQPQPPVAFGFSKVKPEPIMFDV